MLRPPTLPLVHNQVAPLPNLLLRLQQLPR